jgi:hypothetical protein
MNLTKKTPKPSAKALKPPAKNSSTALTVYKEIPATPVPVDQGERSTRSRRSRPQEPTDPDEPEVLLLPGVSKRTLRRLNSMFGQRSDTIIQLLELSDTDGAASLTTRTLIQTLVDVLPLAERGVRRSNGMRGVMGLNQIISQIRELLHDLQAYKDRDLVAERIVEKFVRPMFMDLAMQLTTMVVELDAIAKKNMNNADYGRYHESSEQMKKGMAEFMHRQFDALRSGLQSSL